MNDLIKQLINANAERVYHFRKFWNIDGSEDMDQSISSDYWELSLKKKISLDEYLRKIFINYLQY